MKNTITIKTTGTMAGSVFFGSASVILDSTQRTHRFNVCNHLEHLIGQPTLFRWITKVKAGWNTIQEFTAKPEELVNSIGKSVQCIQIKIGKDQWFDIYNTKSGIWANIDVTLLDRFTVGDIRQGAPKMASNQTWEQVKAKTWADLAFVNNK